MKISYTPNIAPSILKTNFVESSIRDSQFFIYKEEGHVSFDVEVISDINYTTQIHEVVETAKKYIVKANTDNIIATNVIIDNVPYYFKIDYIGGMVGLTQVLLNTIVDCVEKDGFLYTNDVFSNLEISPGVFIYSSPILTSANGTIVHKNKHIEIEFPKGSSKLYFKPLFKNILQPSFVSPFKVHLNSFYIEIGRNLIKCIEGDINYFEKTEFTNDVGNSIQCKDLVYDSNNHFYNSMYNRLYFDKFYYSRTNRNLISYTAKQSSHVFNIKDTLLLKITDQGIVEVLSEQEADFKIFKNIDKSKIKIHLSESLNTPVNIIKPTEYIFSNSDVDMNSKVSLKELVKTSLKRFPSERYYITHGDVTIYQHNNSILDGTQIPVVEMDDVVDKAYEKNQNVYSGYRGNKILDTTYYRIDSKLESLLLDENGIKLNTEKSEQILTG